VNFFLLTQWVVQIFRLEPAAILTYTFLIQLQIGNIMRIQDALGANLNFVGHLDGVLD
jgi:hypothetical protein